ncbi:MAG: chemotaxis protein CheW [Campylobacterota bacterium]|nr:chemotaxis protein CheW [Campylobacterota bacterium]
MSDKSLETISFILFSIDGVEYAIDSVVVEQVIQIVEITPLPNEIKKIAGVINFHGSIIPVLKLKYILFSKEQSIDLNDKFIIIKHNNQLAALWVNEINTVFESYKKDESFAKEIYEELHFIEGVIPYKDRMLPVLDIDKLFDNDMLVGLKKHIEENGLNYE